MATLDLAGIITRVCTDLKLRFAAIIHNHSASDITSGTLAESRGGTGKSSFGTALDSECYTRALDSVGDYGAIWLDDDDKVHVGGRLPVEYGPAGNSGTWYGTCSTSEGTAAKAVTCTGFVLQKGAIIAILFTTANTAATPTLNVNSTGAKTIYVGNGTVDSTTNTLKWSANTLLYFIYDGTYFRYLGARTAASVVPPDGAGVWYGTSSTAEGTAAKASSITNFRLMKGSVVSVTFTTANTVSSSALTLNINSTGAKTIYVNNVATSATNHLLWNAGETLTFVYSGSYWYLISRFLVESDFVKLNNENLVLPNNNIARSDAYNEDNYGGSGSVILTDVYDQQLGYIQTIQKAGSDGITSKIAIQIGGNNHDEDDYNTLALGFDENDNPWTVLSYPAAFREALNLGEEKEATTQSTNITIANNTNVNLNSISPGKGVWIISGTARWSATTSGSRMLKLSTVSADTDTPHNVTGIPYGPYTYANVKGVFNLSATDTVYLIAYQNSSESITLSNRQLKAFRIG